MTQIAAIIVSYFPDENLIALVNDITGQFNDVLIVDNGSGDSLILKQIEEHQFVNVRIKYLTENFGIATALNYGIRDFEDKGYKYVATFDQDSRIPNNYVSEMMNFINNQSASRIGMVAPNFIDVNSNTQAKFTKLNRFTLKFQTCNPCLDYLETTFAISSGTILVSSIFKEVGLFQENLFIDHVDTEYCLRLAKFNYKVFINCKLTIKHSIGTRQKEKILGVIFKPNNHSPLRRYYIFRNGIYLCNKYFKEYPSFLLLNLMRMIHEILCILFFEKQKSIKLWMVVIGVIDGLRGRLGKYQTMYHKENK